METLNVPVPEHMDNTLTQHKSLIVSILLDVLLLINVVKVCYREGNDRIIKGNSLILI